MAERVLVIGGTGLVGNALLRAWKARGADVAAATYHCHASGGFLQLDLQDERRVRALLRELRPTVVAVPAANPYVDYCQTHPGETRRVNVDGALNAARACREIGARMVFFSSDYVFDGRKGSYVEEDAPCPLNEYGRQKMAAEAGVLAAAADHLVVRTSGAYGWQWEPKNFVLQVRERLSRGKTMTVAGDVRYNPTYVENLAQAVVELIAAGARGLFHVVGSEELARSDFARMAAEAFRLDPSLIRAVASKELGSPTPRPRRSSLRTGKFGAIVSLPLLSPAQGLATMLGMESAWREYAGTLPDPSVKTLPPPRMAPGPGI